jgi:hypothetical protein
MATKAHPKKFIIITSIFKPSEAVRKFAKFKDWQVVVVGDKKTPQDWQVSGVIYLSPKDQDRLGFAMGKKLPWNHYCRKMIGYLYAMSKGAEVIYDTDDDNIPLSNWFEPAFSGKFRSLGKVRFINLYKLFTKIKVWPRGLPLDEILAKSVPKIAAARPQNIGMWQFLANNDPDVDSIYRLTNYSLITFKGKESYVVDKNSFFPMNSQNTFFRKETFPLLYMPAHVTIRFTDILRGYVAQPILWSLGMRAGFGPATVVQYRNDHNLMRDFKHEIPVFTFIKEVAAIGEKVVNNKASVHKNLISMYTALAKAGIVPKEEVELVKLWVQDLKTLGY